MVRRFSGIVGFCRFVGMVSRLGGFVTRRRRARGRGSRRLVRMIWRFRGILGFCWFVCMIGRLGYVFRGSGLVGNEIGGLGGAMGVIRAVRGLVCVIWRMRRPVSRLAFTCN